MNTNKSVTANFVPVMGCQPPLFQGGPIRLEWVGGGTLQTATNVLGVWSDWVGAVSPYVTPPSNSVQFYRGRQ